MEVSPCLLVLFLGKVAGRNLHRFNHAYQSPDLACDGWGDWIRTRLSRPSPIGLIFNQSEPQPTPFL